MLLGMAVFISKDYFEVKCKQRWVEVNKRGVLYRGTWAINAYLRAMGAKISKEVNIRFANLFLTPDVLDIAEG